MKRYVIMKTFKALHAPVGTDEYSS